jgi:DNA helicase-2/ATP-dependent DNA helicase PcrA
MDSLIKKKQRLKEKLNKYQNKIYSIENELIELELEISSFDNMELFKSIELNDQQKEIVNSTEKNILVVAVPGSGKTHTLINRYVDLVINKNINPNNIILITFTKKSGQEMYDRINNYVPNKMPFYVGSLHGLAYKMLNKNNYSILDDKDTNELLFDCSSNITNNEFILKNIIYFYDKLSCNYPINIDNTMKNMDINLKFKKIINQILKNYSDIKKKQKLLDFNDLMILFNKYLNTDKSNEFKNNIQYIFFDEFQDINPIQYSILEQFNKSNIMVVGDDSQSIYGFRGSDVNFILNYKSDKQYYLENNYRSTPSIVRFFNNIIKFNTNKINKDIKSVQEEDGIRPIVRYFKDPNDQYKYIVNEIKNNYNNGVKLSEMVILARTNKSLTNIELILNEKNIAFIKSSGLSLLNKKHIKDYLSILSFLFNEKNTINIKRIINLHKIDCNFNIDISLEFLFENKPEFKILFNSLKNNEINVQLVLIKKYLEKFYKDELKDINILINYLKNANGKTIKESYDNLFLNTDLESNSDKLLLSTIHGSKGLEWKYVYIIDCNNKSLPNIRPTFYKDEIGNYEEERRLFYVACSRAKKYLYLTYTDNISPFIKQLDENNYINNNIIIKDKKKTNTFNDIKNNLIIDGYDNYMLKLKDYNCNIIDLGYKLDIDVDINNYIDTFLLNIQKKILYNRFSDKVKLKLNKCNEKDSCDFRDTSLSCNDIITTIDNLTKNSIRYKYQNNSNIIKVKKYDYNVFEKLYFKNLKCNSVIINNDDSIIIDNDLYIIKNSTKNICSVLNVLRADYIKLNNSNIWNIHIINPIKGILYKLF